jgi:hypothetical protein
MANNGANMTAVSLQKRNGGRPRSKVSAEQVSALRAQGLSWREVGRTLGISSATARRLCDGAASVPKPCQNPEGRKADPQAAPGVEDLRRDRLRPANPGKDDRIWPLTNGRSPGPCSRCGCPVWRLRADGALDCTACKPLNEPL